MTMVRTYSETVKKWAKSVGITGVSMFVLIFAYLQFIGAITLTGTSGDSTCDGTIEDPCYAYINFTANEDVFLYPVGYDPWGRNTPFQFDPNVKDWKMQRRWGRWWRDIPLDQGCTGTWCGGKSFNTVANPATYSIAFRKGRDYQIRIVAYKESPLQDIKWFSDDWKVEDPLWLAGKNLTIVHPCIENKTIHHKKIDKCFEEIHRHKLPCTPLNDTSCLYNKTTHEYYKWISWTSKECSYIYWDTIECAKYSKQKDLKYGDKEVPEEELFVDCNYGNKEEYICCVYPNDNDGSTDCRYGKTYAYYELGKKINYVGTGNRKAKIEDVFKEHGIE